MFILRHLFCCFYCLINLSIFFFCCFLPINKCIQVKVKLWCWSDNCMKLVGKFDLNCQVSDSPLSFDWKKNLLTFSAATNTFQTRSWNEKKKKKEWNNRGWNFHIYIMKARQKILLQHFSITLVIEISILHLLFFISVSVRFKGDKMQRQSWQY